MAAFFTSDTHFGHAGARSLYRRPFASVAEMNAAMLDRWNTTVRPEDEIWHLGDFALGMPAATTAELLSRLNGRKHLITANNDSLTTTNLPGSELFFYAVLLHDAQQGVIGFPEKQAAAGVQVTHLVVAASRGVQAVLLSDRAHPLLDKKVFALLNAATAQQGRAVRFDWYPVTEVI